MNRITWGRTASPSNSLSLHMSDSSAYKSEGVRGGSQGWSQGWESRWGQGWELGCWSGVGTRVGVKSVSQE